jgi:MFS family permease
MRCAIRANCWGAIPQVMIKDSSVLIIFASLIGASEMVSVMSTSVHDLALCFLMLPLAWLSNQIGFKRQIITAAIVGSCAMLGTAATPWLGPASGVVMMLCLCVFAAAMTSYTAAWFPLLDLIVPPNERGLFFGRIRFAWQSIAALFILSSGWFVGRYATIGRLQVIIALAGLASLGRAWYVARIPVATPPLRAMDLKTGFTHAVRNRQLTGFSVYLFFLYLAANATTPIIFVFARNYLQLPDNMIVMLSAVAMGGLLIGYAAGGPFVHRYGVKGVFLGAHLGFAVVNFLLLTIHDGTLGSVIALGTLLALFGMLLACASIAVSSELMALAPGENKAVSIAFGYSLYAAGLGGSRILAALILGSGMLAPQWHVGGVTFTHYHSLFLCFGCGVLLAMSLLVLVPAMIHRVEPLPAG